MEGTENEGIAQQPFYVTHAKPSLGPISIGLTVYLPIRTLSSVLATSKIAYGLGNTFFAIRADNLPLTYLFRDKNGSIRGWAINVRPLGLSWFGSL